MTQLDLLERPIVPPAGSQCAELLEQMQHGERYTVKRALAELGIYALSQRCGDLRRKYHWPIKSRMVPVGESTVAEYWLER